MTSGPAQVVILGFVAFVATIGPAMLLLSKIGGDATGSQVLTVTVLRYVSWPGLFGTFLTMFGARNVGLVLNSISLAGVLFLCVMLNFLMFLFIPAFALWGAVVVMTTEG